MRASVLVSVSLSFLVACDGPGGGGGGVDCTANPTAPACQRDTTSSADVLTPTDSQSNTATSPADTTTNNPECNGSERRCNGSSPQQCLDGHWQNVTACNADESCVSGNCVPDGDDCCVGMECGTDCGVSCGTCSGATTCQGGQCIPEGCVPDCGGGVECGDNGCGGSCGTCGPTNHCSDGQCVPNACQANCTGKECGNDGCGGSCGTCGGNETCQSSQCVPGTSDGANCEDTIDCIYADTGCFQFADDDEQFSACADQCLADASETGASEFNALITCDATCESDPICYAEECGFEQAQCFFDGAGNGGCVDIFNCMGGCADGDDICVTDCYENSTATAQGQAISYVLCVNELCPEGSAETCVDDAIAGDCANVYNACVSN